MMNLFGVMFFIVFGVIVYTVIQGIAEWDKNNKSPRLSVNAVIADKRSHTTHHHNHHHNQNGAHMHITTTTFYYVTFEFENGNRAEFRVPKSEYGLLVAGDVGKLSFQGTRYIGFERNYDL